MVNRVGGFWTALAFLTRLPVPGGGKRLTPTATAFFPLVGALLGVFYAVAGRGVDRWAGSGPAAAVVLLLSFWLTGGLHLDGFADTVDGLHAPPHRSLEVMRDSRMGALGGAGLVLLLLLQYSLLARLLGRGEWEAIFLAPVVARLAMAQGAFLGSEARRDGLGRLLLAKVGGGSIVTAAVFGVLAAATAAYTGLVALVVGAVSTYLWGRSLQRRFGGLTGDNLGFLGETAGTLVLAVFAVLPGGWGRW